VQIDDWAGRYTCGVSVLDIDRLTSEEQLQLLEELWEHLSAKPEALPLTEAQRDELDRRLDDLDRDGPSGIPWDEVLRRVRGQTR
jgi:putative addiction module component (TIGR02574 family)